MKNLLTFYLQYWRGALLVLAPLFFLPLPVLVPTTAARCGYVILVMAAYWVTESVHLAATALIPIFAFPLLGILSTKEVCLAYMKDTNMLFLGGLAMAAAIENSGLHERVALFILCKIGSSAERLLLGFMIAQMFLSMWISNTAATAMMVPIVDALLSEVHKLENSARDDDQDTYYEAMTKEASVRPVIRLENIRPPSGAEENQMGMYEGKSEAIGGDAPETSRCDNNLRDILYLGIAYASNIGGTGSLTGTNPNLVLVGFLQLWYGNADTGINYATWLLFNVPGMIMCTALGYIWLRIVLLYYSNWKRDANHGRDEAVQSLLSQRFKALGRISYHETIVASLFGLAVLLWLLRKPEIIGGWGPLLEDFTGTKVSAATPAILVVFLMFAAPSQPFWRNNQQKPGPGCLTWDIFHHKVPWGVIILIGGGFAMAEGGKISGMSAWLGSQFALLSYLPKEAVLFIICVLTALLTEVMSNTAASSLLIPVLNDMSLSMKVNPIYFLLPVSICSSYAFMLPVATPPNAIVYESAKTMPISRMMSIGVVMNILCVLIAYLMINTLGNVVFDLNTFPQWANATIGV